MDYKASEVSIPKMFSFHCDQQQQPVNLKVYGNDGQVLAESGYGLTYESFVEVAFPVDGIYRFCFEKFTRHGNSELLEASICIFD